MREKFMPDEPSYLSRFHVLLIILSTALAILATACSGEDDAASKATISPPPSQAASSEPSTTPEPATPTAMPASPTTEPPPSPTATAQPADSFDSLSLVYVDRRRAQGGDIYVAEADGANPRLVATETNFRRPIDVRGNVMAAVVQDGVALIDLKSGDVTTFPEPRIIFDGRFFDDRTFFYSVSNSCTQGGGALYRIDLLTNDVTELVTSESSLTIAGLDPAGNVIALVPRGCDVAINGIDLYDTLTGQLHNSLPVEGCGWAIAAPDQNKAVASWQACTPPANHAGADATVYDFGIVGPVDHDVMAPGDRPIAAIWLLRPGHAEVALGTLTNVGTGPGSERGTGIFTLDLTNRQFTQLVGGEGAEQYPIAWSPDGRYLLYAIVEAQGVCHFAYVDAVAANPHPLAINPDITYCGPNGQMVGWTELP